MKLAGFLNKDISFLIAGISFENISQSTDINTFIAPKKSFNL